jgi:outer membrane biosynthesis protein TonB
MTPESQPKKRKNSSRANFIISAVFHAVLLGTLFYFAAREGLIGKQLQKIAVEMVKEKKPEPEKPKPEPPKVEPPKIEPPHLEMPKMAEVPKAAAPANAAPPVMAPPAADLPSFEFSGGKAVNSESDPVQLFKGYIEYTLRAKWNRPENLPDDSYVAEVAVAVDAQGNLRQPKWLKGSGDEKWDQSVRDVFKAVQNIDRHPPTNFPPVVTIRFDVQEATEPVITP